MRLTRLLTTTVAALIFATSAAHAGFSQVFDYTGSIVQWTVPTSGLYDIVAYGAQGGGVPGAAGGLGAQMGGSVLLTAGDIYSILVGGAGVQNSGSFLGGSIALAGSGGGGTFVVGSGNTPLVVAGGGGGASLLLGTADGGGAGLTGTSGGNSPSAVGGTGGSAGSGATSTFGGSGGGFSGDGISDSNGFFGNPGFAFINGGAGGASTGAGSVGGGFGGGGSTDDSAAAGGGGGYSGGAAGPSGGGGGGSFLATSFTNAAVFSGVRSGNGQVTITAVSTIIPEPGTALFGLALVGVATVRRRR